MEKILSVILTIVVVFWLLGLLFRVILRTWILKKQKEFANQMGGPFAGFGQRQYNQQTQNRPEGDVKIQKTDPVIHKNLDKTIGEYVEFEEENSKL